MLFKLIKHDFKNSFKDYALLYILMIVFSILSPLLINWSTSGIIGGLASIMIVFLVIGSTVMVFVNTISFIKRRLFSDSSYLNYTLPVSMAQTLLSKLIVSISMIILTSILALASLALFTYVFSLWESTLIQMIWSQLKYFFVNLPDGLLQVGLELLVLYFVELSTMVLVLILSFTLVNTSFVKKKSNVFVLLLYMLISFGISMIDTAVMAILSIDMSAILDALSRGTILSGIHLSIGVTTVYQLLISGALFLITNYLLNNYLEI